MVHPAYPGTSGGTGDVEMKTSLRGELLAAEVAVVERMNAASENLANARLAVKKHLAEFQQAVNEHARIRALIDSMETRK
jgi:hypothetical protein